MWQGSYISLYLILMRSSFSTLNRLSYKTYFKIIKKTFLPAEKLLQTQLYVNSSVAWKSILNIKNSCAKYLGKNIFGGKCFGVIFVNFSVIDVILV